MKNKIKYIIAAIVFALTSCTNRVLEKNEVKEFVTVKYNSGKNDTFSVVRINQINRLKGISKSFYMGSDSQFDYFFTDKKMIYSNEVENFAIKIGECKISNSTTIEEEYNWRTAHKLNARRIKYEDEMCAVGS